VLVKAAMSKNASERDASNVCPDEDFTGSADDCSADDLSDSADLKTSLPIALGKVPLHYCGPGARGENSIQTLKKILLHSTSVGWKQIETRPVDSNAVAAEDNDDKQGKQRCDLLTDTQHSLVSLSGSIASISTDSYSAGTSQLQNSSSDERGDGDDDLIATISVPPLTQNQKRAEDHQTSDSESSSDDWSDSDEDLSDYDELVAALPMLLSRAHPIPAPQATSGATRSAPFFSPAGPQSQEREVFFGESLHRSQNSSNLPPVPESSSQVRDDTGSSMESDLSTSTESSSDCSGFAGEDNDELLATVPIATKRRGPRQGPHLATCATPQEVTTISPSEPTTEMPYMGEGLDLNMLKNFRADLEKVGQCIVNNRQGEKFLQRAHILASINMLAANVPTCVVDHLGQEIRDSIAKKEQCDAQSLASFGGSLPFSDDDSLCSNDWPADQEMCSGEDQQSGQHDSLGDLSAGRRNFLVRNISDTLGSVTSGQSRGSEWSARISECDASRKRSYSLDSTVHSGCSRTYDRSTDIDCDLGVIPAAAFFEGAIMFVDISGFTKLSTVLDPERLSKVINSYFHKIVQKVEGFGGDVQKFAGDALFAEWRVGESHEALENCVAAATACATSMMQDCADFPVLSVVSSKEILSMGATSLNIHLGLGVGQMMGLHVGDSKYRREYLYIGDTINQATDACSEAKLGEAIGSNEFYRILSTIGSRSHDSSERAVECRLVADRNGPVFDVSNVFTDTGARNANSRGMTDKVDGLEVEALIEYRRLMSLYVHPVVVSNDLAAANNFKTSKVAASANERHREEAELRSVYVMFLSLKLPVCMTGDLEEDGEAIHKLNDAMSLVSRNLNQYCGHLRQFIVDDKGYTMVVTFGLRGSTFPKMVSERALPATLLIHQALKTELGIECKIGATFGDAYCGAVGGEKRFEYAVMGPSVNLAARLMSSPDNPGILVDKNIRQLVSRSYCFKALEPLVAKGYTAPVPIFEPLNSLEKESGGVEPIFVGRYSEASSVVEIAEEILSTPDSAAKFVLIRGQSGLGKTSLLAHTIKQIRSRVCAKKNSLIVSQHRAGDSDMFINFATIRPLLISALQYRAGTHSEETVASTGTVDPVSSDSESKRLLSKSSAQSGMTGSQIAEAIADLGRELKSSSLLVDSATQYLIEHGRDTASGLRICASKRAIAGFFVHCFLRCVENVGLAVLAIDDIHRTDEWSWIVLRRIFENADNVLLIGTSSFDTLSFPGARGFADDIHDIYMENGRFREIELDPLGKEDVETLCIESLGLTKSELSSSLLSEVVVQSGGIPQFACNILEGINQRSIASKRDSASGVAEETPLAEILLHRIDSFELAVRATLNIAAVLGLTFKLGDVVSVLFESAEKNAKKHDVRAEVVGSLKVAVQQGFLLITRAADDSRKARSNGTFDEDDDAAEFRFCQDVWRTTLLGLMLESRKRDIHHKMASAMETAISGKEAIVEYLVKIFYHWKESGSTDHTTRAALRVGTRLEQQDSRMHESIKIYEDTLDAFGWIKPEDRSTCGFAHEILRWLPSADIINVVEIMNALGKAHAMASQHLESADMYENALRVMQSARLGRELKDKSVAFYSHDALLSAIEAGHIVQDADCHYEQALIHSFLQEARVHGRHIHHIHALSLQMRLYSRLGQLDKAIAVYSVLKMLYKAERHSKALRSVYCVDLAALSFSLVSYIYMVKGDRREALRNCRRVLKELIPTVGETDFDQAFALAYPLVFVLKETGYANEAQLVFDTVFRTPYEKCDRPRKSGFVVHIFEPLSMLLSLSGVAEIRQEKLEECLVWIRDRKNLRFDDDVNRYLGQLGRCAYSIRAEICLQVAKEIPEKTELRKSVIAFGSIAASAAIVNNRKYVHKMALIQAERLQTKLIELSRDELLERISL
jgi:class 3 adenylate cyclase